MGKRIHTSLERFLYGKMKLRKYLIVDLFYKNRVRSYWIYDRKRATI